MHVLGELPGKKQQGHKHSALQQWLKFNAIARHKTENKSLTHQKDIITLEKRKSEDLDPLLQNHD